MPRTYTPEEKAEALRIHVELGPTEASRRTGIPAGTIASWAMRSGVKTEVMNTLAKGLEVRKLSRSIKKQQLAEKLLDDAEKLRKQIFGKFTLHHFGNTTSREGGATITTTEHIEQVVPQPPPREKRELLQALAIAVDKSQLLAGEATSRNEHLSVAELKKVLDDAIPDPDARRRLALQVLPGGIGGMGEAGAAAAD